MEFQAWKRTQQPENPKLMTKARHVRMFPTPEQVRVLDKWFLACKKTWNMEAHLVGTERCEPDAMKLEKQCVTKAGLQGHKRAQWVTQCPSAIRKKTTRQFAAAHKTAVKNVGAGNFTVRPQSYKDRARGMIGVEHQYTTLSLGRTTKDSWVTFYKPTTVTTESGTLYPGTIRLAPIKKKDRRPVQYEGQDMNVVKKMGRYYLVVPFSSPTAAPATAAGLQAIQPKDIIALDPGIRTFMTGYCPADGQVLEYGKESALRTKLSAARNHIRGIDSKLSHPNCTYQEAARRVVEQSNHATTLEECKATQQKIRREYHRRISRLRAGRRKYERRLDNLITDFHWKTCSELLSRFKHVILPPFSSRCACRLDLPGDYKLYAKNLNHFNFRQRLLQKTWQYPESRVWIGGEHYTTRTCGSCGKLNTVGGAETFHCRYCHLVCGRDANASRNIYMKMCFGTSK